MQITIKTLNGNKRNFDCEPETTVLQVKEFLQEKEGIFVAQIRLIFNGKQLADESPLGSYNIAPGAVVHMVLQLRGGN